MDEPNMDTRTELRSSLYQYDDSVSDFSSEYKLDNFDGELDLSYPLADSQTWNNTLFYDIMDASQTNDESNEFRTLIVSIGLVLVSIGILSNLLFILLVLCRRPKRKTSSSLIMSSICLAYILFFIFYCFKIVVYFNVETIIKFHNYDVTENWIFGSFLCKFVHALPIWCKIFTRLSILVLIVMRILSLLIRRNCVSNSKSLQDANINVIKDKNKKSILGLSLMRKCFECPVLLVIIALVWVISLLASGPLFFSYTLNHVTNPPICDSVYQFPDDLKKVANFYFNYFIYGSMVPCFLILLTLIVLSLFQLSRGSSLSAENSKPHSTNLVSSKETRSNNFLLWLAVIVHLGTSFPQELYRYSQLVNTDVNDPVYIEMVLLKPLALARPYYLIQLLYISEFALIPLIFLTFFTCSSKLEDLNCEYGEPGKNRLTRALNFCCYDYNLVGVVDSGEKTLFNNTTDQSLNDALLDNQGSEVKSSNGLPSREIAIDKDQSFYEPDNQNVLHIIQHPSWRINIKQQSNSSSKNSRGNKYANETNGSVQLPFNYMKSNM
ncbi:hypothetical protein BpHYR1_015917 [Brachionus plicatilis]|uniref:G-protein coupled receptors family 1 profile domain-containing protein n=1 Tax=Brachionus plicatilis TaxID=10195 RepID=A0A3M7P505_BRAPC|nr:hypothetical protein BpHYR1_015917 [Brachionus plicatilis]